MANGPALQSVKAWRRLAHAALMSGAEAAGGMRRIRSPASLPQSVPANQHESLTPATQTRPPHRTACASNTAAPRNVKPARPSNLTIRVALNAVIAHVMNGRKSESRIERSSASESDCRDPPIAALANPALFPRGRSFSGPKRVAAVPWDVLRPDRLPVPRRSCRRSALRRSTALLLSTPAAESSTIKETYGLVS